MTDAAALSPVTSIADLPAQSAGQPASKAESRARYFNSGNAFNVRLPAVPNAVFVDEPRRALDPATPTGLIACDASAAMQCSFPATAPLVLARYARIRAGAQLQTDFVCSGAIFFVIQGHGQTEAGDETIHWRQGDLVMAPGDHAQRHIAIDDDAVLWVVTNEPQLAFENLRAPAPGNAPSGLVHYPAAEIDRQLETLYTVGSSDEIAGLALIFSSDQQAAGRNILPSLTAAMNSLPPGGQQRAHRHNSVAVSLVVDGDNCFSMIDGERKDWAPWATTITPPVSAHSHHNDGDRLAKFLIVQDGGLYYHARTMGFEFTDT